MLSLIWDRADQSVHHLHLEDRHYSMGINDELEENRWSWKYKKLNKSPTIFLDGKRRVVMYPDIHLPDEARVKKLRYGSCSQEGLLDEEDVQAYYEHVDGSNYFQKKVPKELSGLFQENGLCDYRPLEMIR